MKFLILAMFVGILLSLGSALSSMTRGPSSSKSMANALTVRVALSAALVVMLVLASVFGWIEPRGA